MITQDEDWYSVTNEVFNLNPQLPGLSVQIFISSENDEIMSNSPEIAERVLVANYIREEAGKYLIFHSSYCVDSL